MEEKRNNFGGFAVILALGFIIGALIMSSAWKKVANNNITITVTGSASKEIKSDLGIWNGMFSAESTTMEEAYKKLQETNSKIKNYLISFGFPAEKIVFSSINTTPNYDGKSANRNPFVDYDVSSKSSSKITGYSLTQSVKIESPDVDKIDLLSRSVTELINQGIAITSGSPTFLYTKLSDLKIEMIGLASQDAKIRAEQIAKATGNKVGDVRSSRTGVMQVNAKNSTDVTDYGMNDTSSIEKTITAVVNVSFLID